MRRWWERKERWKSKQKRKREQEEENEIIKNIEYIEKRRKRQE